MFLKDVVIGRCPAAALYSIINEKYFFATTTMPPIFCEKEPLKVFGSDRADFIWSRALLILSLQGKLISHEDIEGIKITEKEIKVSTSQGVFGYFFDLCEIFDPTGVNLDNEIKEPNNISYTVYDDFELSCLGSKHKFLKPKFSKTENFTSEIHFYISDRVDGAHYVTDCVARSTLTKEQLMDFEYSDSMARFYIERYLTEIGVMGNFMKLYKNGSPKFRKPKVVHKNRIVLERDNNVYVDSKNVKFKNLNVKEVFNDISPPRP